MFLWEEAICFKTRRSQTETQQTIFNLEEKKHKNYLTQQEQFVSAKTFIA